MSVNECFREGVWVRLAGFCSASWIKVQKRIAIMGQNKGKSVDPRGSRKGLEV